MRRALTFALLALVVMPLGAPTTVLRAAQAGAPVPRIRACSLLTKAEVKQHLPWIAALDNVPVEEEEIGPSGSGCTYPTVYVQVLANPQSMIDAAKTQGGLQAIKAVGDEAYFRDNKGRYAELYVRVGQRILTLQADIPAGGTAESVKPGALGLATALATKLPR